MHERGVGLDVAVVQEEEVGALGGGGPARAAAEVARRSDAIQTLGEQLRIAITAADAAGSVILFSAA